MGGSFIFDLELEVSFPRSFVGKLVGLRNKQLLLSSQFCDIYCGVMSGWSYFVIIKPPSPTAGLAWCCSNISIWCGAVSGVISGEICAEISGAVSCSILHFFMRTKHFIQHIRREHFHVM